MGNPIRESFEANFEVRTRTLAADHIQRRIERARKLFERHRKTLDHAAVSIDRLVSDEERFVIEEISAKRNSGRWHRERSVAPGIWVLLEPVVNWSGEKVIDLCARAGDSYASELKPSDEVAGLYELSLPAGGFLGDLNAYPPAVVICEPSVISYDTESGFPGLNFKDFEDRNRLGFGTNNPVIRIEGASGEVWQNTSYDPSGIPK